MDLIPFEQVLRGKEYYISKWVLASCDHLVRNAEQGPYNDAKSVEYKTIVVLCLCRENELYENNPRYLQEAFNRNSRH